MLVNARGTVIALGWDRHCGLWFEGAIHIQWGVTVKPLQTVRGSWCTSAGIDLRMYKFRDAPSAEPPGIDGRRARGQGTSGGACWESDTVVIDLIISVPK